MRTLIEQGEDTFEWQPLALPYTISATYRPDVYLPKTGIFVEIKGFFPDEDRKKMDAVIRQHADKDIRFVWERAGRKLTPKSKRGKTYGDWAKDRGCEWAEGAIPLEWVYGPDQTS